MCDRTHLQKSSNDLIVIYGVTYGSKLSQGIFLIEKSIFMSEIS